MMRALLVTSVLFISSSSAREEKASVDIEIPDVFNRRGEVKRCEDNAMVNAWCDKNILNELDCGILSEFDEYGCTCYGDPSLCPTECIGGAEPLQKTHYGIRCGNIPTDSPNYILKERHALKRCENNLVVASWCDDYVNRHLECGLYPEDDQYLCRCTGKNTNCPDECIGGGEPLVRTQNSVLCSGIPVDSPNYVLKEK